MPTTSEAVYEALKAAVLTVAGMEFSGRILENEQTPKTSRQRSFWLIPTGAVRAPGMITEGAGYRWIDEAYIVRLSHTFKSKRQDTQRALAYADAEAVWDAVEAYAPLYALAGIPEVADRSGPSISSSGDYIETELSVSIRYAKTAPSP